MSYSSIDPREMHRLGDGVQSAGRGLADCAAQLRGLMDMLGITHPGVTTIDRAGRWLTDQAPDLYRRRDLAYEAQNVATDVFGRPAAGAVVPPGMIRIEESRLIPAKTRAEAALAAPLFYAASRGDPDALKRLAAYKRRMSDPAFATALLEELGPEAMVTLPAVMGTRTRDALGVSPEAAARTRRENGEVLALLSKALATATTPTGPRVSLRFLEELKRQGRKSIPVPEHEGATYPGYWALGQLLAATPKERYSAWFMSTIGRDMIRWDRDYLREHGVHGLVRDGSQRHPLAAPTATQPFAGSSAISTVDPIAALTRVAGTSRESAQALLRPGDTLKYLLHDRRAQWGMSDRGEALGEAMEAGMKGADADSKRLAVLATQIIADDVRPHVSFDENGKISFKDPSELDKLSGIRDNMGRVLAEHSDDVVSAFYKNYARAQGGELTGVVEGLPIGQFSAADVDLVMLDVATDDRGYHALLTGQVAHMRGEVDEAVAARDNTLLQNVITNDSKALGHLFEARKQALVAMGKESDEADAAFGKMVEDGIGLVPIPFAQQVGKAGVKIVDGIYENFVKDGYAKAGDWLIEQSGHGGGETVKNFAAAASDQIAAEQMVKQMLESSAVTYGYHEHSDLKGQPFVEGDPPRIKSPLKMTRYEYDNFVRWMDAHAKVPDDFGNAQTKVKVGADEFTANVGGSPPEDERDG
ncbi:hypothetical protein [Nonomuraea sp. NPDC002799]